MVALTLPGTSGSYLQLVEGESAQAVIYFGIVQGLLGALQPGRAEGERLQVAIFSHLVHVQGVVYCSQAVKGHQLLPLIT